jgi:hypothetical protein
MITKVTKRNLKTKKKKMLMKRNQSTMKLMKEPVSRNALTTIKSKEIFLRILQWQIVLKDS